MLEDTKRMVEVTERVADILRGAGDWPTPLVEFAREAIPPRLPPWGWDAKGSDERGEPEAVFDLLSRPSIANVAANEGLDQYVLYRALAELQQKLYDSFSTVVRDWGVGQYVATHLVVAVNDQVLTDALPTYGDPVHKAVAQTHDQACPCRDLATETPLLIACTPDDVVRAHRIEQGISEPGEG